MSHRLVSCAGLLLAELVVGLLPASEGALDVRLKEGGTRTGIIDISTNESSLRLRIGEPDAYIVYGIEWEEIAEIRHGQEVWLPERFNEFRAQMADQSVARRAANEWQDSEGPSQAGTPTLSSKPLWQSHNVSESSEGTDARVQFIEIDAVAANWNANVELCGIVLRVWPMNQRGEVVRTSGRLEVTLSADRGDPPQFDLHTDRVQPVDHWVRWLREASYGNDGANVRLEFQNIRPEPRHLAGTDRWHVYQAASDWWLRNNSGDVHVRLTVPGQGVFAASTSLPVRLSRFSPLRDRHFIRNGTRFFPHE